MHDKLPFWYIENNKAKFNVSVDVIGFRPISLDVIGKCYIDPKAQDSDSKEDWQSMPIPQTLPRIPNNQMPYSHLWDDKNFKPSVNLLTWY